MSWDFCTTTTPVARKKHVCEATNYLTELHVNDVQEDDRELFQKLLDQRYILPGEKYLRCSGVWEGKWTTLKARLDAHRLCAKYEMYDDQ